MAAPELFSLLQDVAEPKSSSWGPPTALAAATVVTGLSAGVFFTFQVAINDALKRVNDDAYVAIFQSINRVIVNPWFMGVFLGSPVVIAVAGILHWNDHRTIAWVIVVALVLQLVNIGITSGGNVPLNLQLDRAGAVQGVAATQVRAAFEDSWNRFHLLRTLASVGSLVALGVATVMAIRN